MTAFLVRCSVGCCCCCSAVLLPKLKVVAKEEGLRGHALEEEEEVAADIARVRMLEALPVEREVVAGVARKKNGLVATPQPATPHSFRFDRQ